MSEIFTVIDQARIVANHSFALVDGDETQRRINHDFTMSLAGLRAALAALDASEPTIETELIARLMREKHGSDGWRVSLTIDEIPNEIGNYGVYDGLRCWGGGVTRRMRDSVVEMSRSRPFRRPLYCWRPDIDGSSALWLEGKMRCGRCKGKPIFDLNEIDQHGRDVHGDDPECKCD